MMKNNEEILAILKKYADCGCSPEEAVFIRSWLYENIAGNEYDEVFERLLESCRPEMDSERLAVSYGRLENRLNALSDVSGKRNRAWVRRSMFFSLAAACAAVLFFLVLHLFRTAPADSSESGADVSMCTFYVPAGSNADFRLSDGTVLKVNAATTVKYPKTFSGGERRIYIDGEAYLDVADDSDNPFIVETEDFEVKVYGTEFNVNTYGREMAPYVVLVSGSVEVSDENGACMMKPGMMAVSAEDGLKVRNVDVEEFICWKDGYIILNGMGINTISTRLSLYYGIDVGFSGADSHLYGKLDLTDDITDVFENISKIAPIDVKRTQTGYMLTSN